VPAASNHAADAAPAADPNPNDTPTATDPTPEAPAAPPTAPAARRQAVNPPSTYRYPKRVREPSVQWFRNQQACLSATGAALSDNPTYKEAMNTPDKELWEAATNEELAALQAKHAFTDNTLPPVTTALPSKLVLGIKCD
jgi:hypothetical protein